MKQYKDKEKLYRDQLKKLKFEDDSPSPPSDEQLEEMVKGDVTMEVSVEEEKLSIMKPNLAAIEEYRKKEEVYKKRFVYLYIFVCLLTALLFLLE